METKFTPRLISIDGFNKEEVKRILNALDAWRIVWNSDEFKQEILNFKYEFFYTTGRLWWKKTVKESGDGFYFAYGEVKLTNQQVYEKIMRESSHGFCDLKLQKHYPLNRWSSAVADHDYKTGLTRLFSKYMNWATEGQLCNTLSHEEGCHGAGLSHEWNPSASRNFSAPYAIGDITEKLAIKMGLV